MATIRIPTPLRKLTQGKEEVTAAGATVGALTRVSLAIFSLS